MNCGYRWIVGKWIRRRYESTDFLFALPDCIRFQGFDQIVALAKQANVELETHPEKLRNPIGCSAIPAHGSVRLSKPAATLSCDLRAEEKTAVVPNQNSIDADVAEINVKDKLAERRSICIDQVTVVVAGRWIRMASVQDEDWIDRTAATDPETFIRTIKDRNLGADIFAFSQKLPETAPKYDYPYEWDNAAAIPITSYEEWWEKRLPQVTRKNIRRAVKRGVSAKVVEFNDDLVRGIIEIHNDTPTRQGVPFAHYGKDFSVVKRDYGTFLSSSEWVGAYIGNELIGILKLIKMGNVASIMQIVTKTEHYDKRPTNVLIEKAVALCQRQGIAYLVYGKFVYGNKTKSTLTEFKRRNGFERIDYPRYYVPLTAKGRIALKLRLHLGLLSVLPAGVISALLGVRSRYYRWVLIPLTSRGKCPGSGTDVRARESWD